MKRFELSVQIAFSERMSWEEAVSAIAQYLSEGGQMKTCEWCTFAIPDPGDGTGCFCPGRVYTFYVRTNCEKSAADWMGKLPWYSTELIQGLSSEMSVKYSPGRVFTVQCFD